VSAAAKWAMSSGTERTPRPGAEILHPIPEILRHTQEPPGKRIDLEDLAPEHFKEMEKPAKPGILEPVSV